MDETQLKAHKDAAVAAMWAWYQDWAVAARTAVKNRNYLVILGLLKPRGSAALDSDEDDIVEEDIPAAAKTA